MALSLPAGAATFSVTCNTNACGQSIHNICTVRIRMKVLAHSSSIRTPPATLASNARYERRIGQSGLRLWLNPQVSPGRLEAVWIGLQGARSLVLHPTMPSRRPRSTERRPLFASEHRHTVHRLPINLERVQCGAVELFCTSHSPSSIPANPVLTRRFVEPPRSKCCDCAAPGSSVITSLAARLQSNSITAFTDSC
ncbi:hypothetical protein DE146DRAFT_274704 [Phaeosphaeria sp. MPI-PUGE-AT-0046c]|nr:hypothetical protein DE146DRAFT_274704 [Phaeosphaeria sp. MPI-PUGE-AT-0046c]